MSKKDNSPRVHQRNKLKDEIIIKEFEWSEKQKRFIQLALDKSVKIMIVKSPPGTGKTLLSTLCSLKLLSNKSISDILYLRNPVESVSKGLGYLPGLYLEKMQPYGAPLVMSLEQLISKPTYESLMKDNRIKIDSVGFVKGCTYNTTSVICDEAEDLSIQEIRLVFGRMGKFSKLFLIGDEKQANVKNSGFSKTFDLFNDQVSKDNGIVTFEFTNEDCMRNGFMKFILEKFDSL
jgi:phosphate starvation-inducible protein PhoH and related proteins